MEGMHPALWILGRNSYTNGSSIGIRELATCNYMSQHKKGDKLQVAITEAAPY